MSTPCDRKRFRIHFGNAWTRLHPRLAHDGTLYTGVTADLPRRIREHREGDIPGFTKKYGVKRLVWHRFHHNIEDAIADEKRIKKWRGKWKLQLIEDMNPKWTDLFDEIAAG